MESNPYLDRIRTPRSTTFSSVSRRHLPVNTRDAVHFGSCFIRSRLSSRAELKGRGAVNTIIMSNGHQPDDGAMTMISCDITSLHNDDVYASDYQGIEGL